MLQRNFICLLKGNTCLTTAVLDTSEFRLWNAACSFQVRHKSKKTSPFPPPKGNPKIFEELDKEFGWPKHGRKRDSPFVPAGLPFIPVSHPFIIDTVGNIISEYVPLQRKELIFTPTGIKQRWEALKMFLMSTYSIAFIKRYTKPFQLRDFAVGAQKTFIEVNKALQDNDVARLKELCTSDVYNGLKRQFLDANRKIHWRHVGTITPPRIVHARVAPVQDKENLFAQVTVKMHTDQILAITDEHGRRVKGDLKKSKQVIDYVVFERHLTNPYGQWKVIGKIAPPVQVRPNTLKPSTKGHRFLAHK